MRSEGLQTDDVKAIEDGMVFEGEGGLKVRAVHSPGHTNDHCAFVLENGDAENDRGAMFTGDSKISISYETLFGIYHAITS